MLNQYSEYEWDDYYTRGLKTGWHTQLEDILPHLSTARFVKFTGGEPFLIPQVKRIIDWLISEDIYSNIEELTFITNGTIDITEWFPRFEKFKKVTLLISIDAIGDRYEYIRSGSKWSNLENNIDNIIANKKNNTRLCTTILPMALNCNHIDEVVDWCKQKQIEYNISTPVIKPDFLSPLALTDTTLREKLIQQMQIQDKIWNTDYRNFI